jgi:YNFM family putative membrane transporter
LLAGGLADAFSWRVALGGIAALGFACGLAVWRFLPASRHFTARPLRFGALSHALLRHARNPLLLPLFAEGFLLMGGLVAAYNFIGYRLLAPPYALSQAAVGLIFAVYLAGVASSAIMGNLARSAGNLTVVALNLVLMLAGVGLTLARPLAPIVGGVALITAGFFGAHAVVSAWVAVAARENRAQASALYLFSYYAGSSIAGSLAGLVWTRGGWTGVAIFVALLVAAGMAVCLVLARQGVRRAAP